MPACPVCGAVEVICDCDVEEPVLIEPDPEERTFEFTGGRRYDRTSRRMVDAGLDPSMGRAIDGFMRTLGFIVLSVSEHKLHMPDGGWEIVGFNVHVINKYVCLCCGTSIVDMAHWDRTKLCRHCGETCMKEPGHGKVDAFCRDKGVALTYDK